jgi:hypothetical protein
MYLGMLKPVKSLGENKKIKFCINFGIPLCVSACWFNYNLVFLDLNELKPLINTVPLIGTFFFFHPNVLPIV